MGRRSGDPSTPARLAAPDEGIGADELALATRNHGLPLEALRHDVTPPGLHYVLTHYDIPYVPSAGAWRLSVDGRVRVPLDLSLADLLSFPQVTTRVTLECAGNGRALLTPRPVSQPWLVEAVGTADWTGVPLRLLLAEAAPTRRPWTSSSPAPTTGWNAGSNRTTSAPCPWPWRWPTTLRCWSPPP